MPSSTEKRFFMLKKALYVCGRILMVFSIGWLLVALFSNLHELSTIHLGIESSIIFVFSLGYVLLTLVLGAYVMYWLLRCTHVFLSFKQVYIITGIPQVAKYLPGNVFHYVGQIALGRHAGVPAQTMAISLGVQTLFLVLTAGGIACLGLWFDRPFLGWLIQELKTSRFVLLMTLVMGGVLIGVVVILTVFPNIRKRFSQYSVYIHPKCAGLPIVVYVVTFIGYGIMIAGLLGAFWEIKTSPPWYHFTWGFTLAWVLGFVMPGAPGGLGIREMIFFGLYHQELGTGIVIGLSLIVRIITSVADLMTFGIAFCIDRYWSETSLLEPPL